jgi:hypothetical protein
MTFSIVGRNPDGSALGVAGAIATQAHVDLGGRPPRRAVRDTPVTAR